MTNSDYLPKNSESLKYIAKWDDEKPNKCVPNCHELSLGKLQKLSDIFCSCGAQILGMFEKVKKCD